MSHFCETVAAGQPFGEAAMHVIMLIVLGLLSVAAATWAAMGFDERYGRDYNIYAPTSRYEPANPLNPVNKYNTNVAFAPMDRKTNRGRKR